MITAVTCMYSQLSPCRHLTIMDTPIISKNKLQTFDWNKLPVLQTLANEDTNLRSLQCPLQGSWLYYCLLCSRACGVGIKCIRYHIPYRSPSIRNSTSLSAYRPHFCRTNIKQFSILYRGPKIWNSLPVSLISSPSIFVFKKKFKELSHWQPICRLIFWSCSLCTQPWT